MRLSPSLLLSSVFAGCVAVSCAGAGTGVDRWATQDGHRIHFQDSGGEADEALVLVHGWAGSTAAWSKQFPALSDRARVLVVDLVGHGASDAPEMTYTMQRMADSLRVAMDEAGVQRAVLVGHSNGVPVVLDFAHRYPERTLAIVGVDGALKTMMPRETFDAMFAVFREPGWKEVMTGMIAGIPGPELSGEDRAAITAMAVATPHHVVIGAAEATYEPGAFHDPSFDVPLLLLLGRQPTWDVEYEAWVRRSVPQVDYVVWDDVGHYIQMEQPDAFRTLLEDFLERHELLPGAAHR